MKTYHVWFWMIKDGRQVSCGHETYTDETSAKMEAMRAARRGFHGNVICNGRLIYAQ